MDDLEALRKQKLEALKNQQTMTKQVQEQQHLQEQLQAMEQMIKLHLEKDALTRYGTLKTAHPKKAMQLLVVLTQILQQQGSGKITDAMLKDILKQLASGEKDISIKRR